MIESVADNKTPPAFGCDHGKIWGTMIKYVAFSIKLLLTVGFLGLALSMVEPQRLLEAAAQISIITAIVAVLVVLLQSVLLALRWRLIAATAGAQLPLGSSVRATLVSFLFSQGLPASVGADIFRIWWMKRREIPIGKAAGIILFDRFAGFFFLILLATLSLLTLAIGWQPANWAVVVAVFATGGALFALLALFLMGETMVQAVARFLRVDGLGVFLKATEIRGRVRGNILNLFAVPMRGFAFIALNLAIHLLTVAIVFIIANNLDPSVSFMQSFAALPLGLLLSYLPVSIAGWGVRELSFVGCFALVGVSSDVALMSGLVLGLTVLVVSFIGAALWILGGIREQFLATADAAYPREIDL